MKRSLVTTAVVGAVLAALPLQASVAAPPPLFAVSPASLSFTAPEGSTFPDDFAYQFVTVTNSTGRPLVIQNPASSDDGHFFDTQAGSCWQAYEALGNPIPGKASCTIQVGFNSPVPGTFTGMLTVRRCTSWHLDPTFGFILCDTFDGSRSVSLTGTATP